MTLDLPIDDLQKLVGQIGNVPLGSSALDRAPIAGRLSRSVPIGSDVLPLTLNLRGGVEIALFNSLDDKDPDGLLVPAASAADEFGIGPPAVALTADGAWLKYRYDAGLKASVGSSLADLGLKLSAEANASASFVDYRRHAHTELAREALLADLQIGPRLAAVLAHVEGLAIGDAVAIQLAGALKLAVTIAWADVLTGQLGALRAWLQSDAAVGVTVKAGASVTATVALDDDFLVVFARTADEEWRIGVKKAAVRSIGAALTAGLHVQLANPAELAAVIQPVIDGLLAATADRVAPLPEAATLRQAVGDKVLELLKTKIALSFAYEYQRTSTATELLQAAVTRARLRTLHADCMRGDLAPVLSAIRANAPGVALLQFLSEQTLERKSSWGFTLGVGKWLKIGGKDTRDLTSVTRTHIDGRRQESYLGFRGFTGTWMGETFDWSADLKADMAGFSSNPRAADLAYGLHLLWKQTHDRLSSDDVDIFLDAAVLWGAISQVEAARRRPALVASIGMPCTATVQLTVADTDTRPTLRALLGALGAAPGIAAALAAAMPWREGSAGRTQVAVRRALYAPLFQAYLDDPQLTPSDLAAMAHRTLADGDFEDLGRLELNFAILRPFTFAGLAELNPDTPARATAFRAALDAWRDGIDTGAGSEATVTRAFRDLSGFWEQSHHVRAAGAYLAEAARSGGLLDQVRRAATFSVGGATLVLG